MPNELTSTTNMKLTSIDAQISRNTLWLVLEGGAEKKTTNGKLKANELEVNEERKSKVKRNEFKEIVDNKRPETCNNEKNIECKELIKEKIKCHTHKHNVSGDDKEYIDKVGYKIKNMTVGNLDKANLTQEQELHNCATEVMDIGKIQYHKQQQMSSSRKSEVSNCTLCFDGAPDAVLLECGHSGICFVCGKKLYMGGEKCPLCREPIALIVKIDITNKYGNLVKVIDYVSNTINNAELPLNINLNINIPI